MIAAGDNNVKEADWVALEALSLRLVALDIWQTRYARAAAGSVQHRLCQMRDQRLQLLEAIVER